MPIFQLGKVKFFFAHVPKCGGTTIEKGLIESGVGLHFYDPEFFEGPRKWNRSSPQHIANADLERLFSVSFFDLCFAVVRDPVARFLSAFHYNRGVNIFPGRKICWYESVDRFVARLERRNDYFAYRFDNHFVPADFLVPSECKIFYLEDGLESLSGWLCEAAAIRTGGIKFGHENKRNNFGENSSQIKSFVKKHMQAKVPDQRDLPPDLEERIRALYSVDYKRFYSDLFISS